MNGRTAAAPPHTQTDDNGSTPKRYRALSREPAADGNYRVILKLACDVIETAGLDNPEPDADLIELVKQRCAAERIDYGRDPAVAHDVVHRAVTWACMCRRHGVNP